MIRFTRLSVVGIFALLALFSSCKRCTEDSKPEVTTVKAEMIDQSTILVTGKLLEHGEENIEHVGFFYGNSSNVDIEENQVLLDATYGEFTFLIGNVVEGEVYYINTLAANRCAEVIGNEIAFQVPAADPPAVPCTIESNVVKILNGFTYNVSYTYSHANNSSSNIGNWVVDVTTSSPSLYFDFHHKPVNGIYTTSTSSDFEEDVRNVYLRIHSGGIASQIHSVREGTPVYVSVDNEGVTSISICNAAYSTGSHTFEFESNILVN